MADYYIIKMYPQTPAPQLELLTGGWMPVSQIVRGEAAVCVFTDYAKAADYKSSYNQIAMGQIRSMEIESMSLAEIDKLKLISDKISLVALDPTLNFGQFSASEIKPLSEFTGTGSIRQYEAQRYESAEDETPIESEGLTGGEVAGVILCWPYSLYLFFKSLKEYPRKSKQICIIYLIFFVIGVLIQLASEN